VYPLAHLRGSLSALEGRPIGGMSFKAQYPGALTEKVLQVVSGATKV
jgi:hypothetical protein